MDELWRKQNVVTRSVSAENPTGEKGMGGMAEEGYSSYDARELGRGWKVNPFLNLPAGKETDLANLRGPGMIRHFWAVPLNDADVRFFVLRIYWDGCEKPAVETPLGDFFCSANVEYWQISSLPQSQDGLQQLFRDALPPVLPRHRGEPQRGGPRHRLSAGL